jgi:hypothetical protein
VFGQHIDPVEILVQFAVLTVLLIRLRVVPIVKTLPGRKVLGSLGNKF